jgi:hypothetical protein
MCGRNSADLDEAGIWYAVFKIIHLRLLVLFSAGNRFTSEYLTIKSSLAESSSFYSCGSVWELSIGGVHCVLARDLVVE